MSLVQILLIAALFCYAMWRRLAGVPLTVRRLVVLPAILVIWGGYQLGKGHLTGLDVGLLAVEVVVGLGLGLVRGMTVKVYENAGHAWYRYTPVTIAVWFASAVIRAGLGIGGHLMGATMATTGSLIMMLGVTFLGEAALVGPRALRGGVPFARDARTARAMAGRGGRGSR